MSQFIQLHLLTSYAPANLNRDDLGRPKTAKMGGFERLRVSSQSLKRSWRVSELFANEIDAIGRRTKLIGDFSFQRLNQFQALSKDDATSISKNIAKCFGALDGESMKLKTLAYVSNREFQNIESIIETFRNGIDGRSIESDQFGLVLFKELSGELFTLVTELADELSLTNDSVLCNDKMLKAWVDKIKSDDFKAKVKGKDNDFELRELCNTIRKSDEQSILELCKITSKSKLIEYLLSDKLKTAQKLSKKLSGLKSKKEAEALDFGVLMHKSPIKLSKDFENGIQEWHQWAIDNNIQIDSDDSVNELELKVSSAAIDKKSILSTEDTDVDIALFGRMLASSPEFNADAACQVAHAISVHSVVVEDDYFTAIDDLNDASLNTGSAHIGESGFAAALFYSYICINKTQLIDNLSGNEALANAAIRALTEAAVKVSPTGKQNSFASRAYASFALAEKGEQQPRQLSVAFLKPVNDADQAGAAIAALTNQVTNFDKVYGECADTRCQFNAITGEGSLAELLDFVAE